MASPRRLLTSLLFASSCLACSPAWAQEVATQTPPADDGEIIVTGRYIPDEKRETSEIVSLLSSEDIARTGAGDIAGALTKVTGLSLVGGRFVYVRGLGGRYSSTLLDGSVLPSPEPLRRVVPLDVFPTELIDGATVQKTYSVEYPGEFGGGLISLRTLRVPQKDFFTASVSGGFNETSTGKSGLTFEGGDLDDAGFADNIYDLPGAVLTNPSLNGFNASQLQIAGRALVNAGPGFSIDRENNDPDYGAAFTFGRRFDVGGSSAGLVIAATYDNKIRNQNGVRNRFNASGTGLEIVRSASEESCIGLSTTISASTCGLNQTTQTVTLGALASFGIEIDADNNVSAKTIILRKTDKTAQSQRGINNELQGSIVSDFQLAFVEQELLINQVAGEHKFELDGIAPEAKFTWRGSYDRASRTTPYRTEYRYILSPNDTSFQLSGAATDLGINFTALTDDTYEGGIDFEIKGDGLGLETVFKYGGLYTKRDRAYSSRRYSFLFPSGSTAALRRFVPEIIFSPDNIGPGGFTLTQTDGPANSYTASTEITGAYATAELGLTDQLRITGGVRYENSVQIVSGAINGDVPAGGRCVQNGPVLGFATPITCRLTSTDFLPAATATLEFADNMQIRAGYSRTLSRPDLRELSPAVLFNVDEDIEETGDPNLNITSIDNFDARYEWYFGDKQLFSFGGFYKKLKNPIERSINAFGGDAGRRIFINADAAEIYGGEIELDLTVPLDSWIGGAFFEDRRFFTIGNFTYAKSKVTIAPAQAGIATSLSRPLEGQSEFLGNLQLGYEGDADRFALLFTYASKRISDVGVFLLPDVFETPPVQLDLTYSRKVEVGAGEVEVGFKVNNILDRGFKRTQGGQIYEQYDTGRSYSLSFKAKF